MKSVETSVEVTTPAISSGWVGHQRFLWLILFITYTICCGSLFYFDGAGQIASFLWGAGLFCISIALTMRLMSSTVLGATGIRAMMLLSGVKLVLFAGILFAGLYLFSLNPIVLFAGVFAGLVATSGYWFWASKKPASFH